MTTVTLQVEDSKDYELLLQLIASLKLKVVTTSKKSSLQERQKLLSIIKKGGSGKSITDPVKWQKEIRKDRKLR
jgi:hypothetical protein